MGKQPMVAICNPRAFMDYLMALSEGETLTVMAEKMGFSKGYLTESILKRKTISLSGLYSLASYLGTDVETLKGIAGSRQRIANIDITGEQRFDDCESTVQMIAVLNEQARLLKEIGKVLTNIETITEKAWK